MTYFFNIYIYVDIFIIVFYLPFYCNIRYVVLSFDEIKTHYYLLIIIIIIIIKCMFTTSTWLYFYMLNGLKTQGNTINY